MLHIQSLGQLSERSKHTIHISEVKEIYHKVHFSSSLKWDLFSSFSLGSSLHTNLVSPFVTSQSIPAAKSVMS